MNNEDTMDLKSSRHPWSLGHKVKRATWMFVWGVFGKLGPRFFSRFRIGLLRLFGAQIGRNCLFCGGVRVLMPWNLRIGDFTSISEEVDIYNFGQVCIGSNTVLSRGVWLCTGSHDYGVASFPLIWEDITVGDSVWIAAQSFVGPGVTIGNGAVVGARSVVTRDLPNWSISAGNPCKFIKSRQLG